MEIELISSRPIPIEQNYPVKTDAGYDLRRRDVLQTIGSGLIVGLGAPLLVPKSTPAWALIPALVTGVGLAKNLWDLGSSIYGFFSAKNTEPEPVEGPIIIELVRSNILEEDNLEIIRVPAGREVEYEFRGVQTRSVGPQLIYVRSSVNSLSRELLVVG